MNILYLENHAVFAQDTKTIEVIVSGAVQRSGSHTLSVPATIRDGLAAAGGFARSESMWPSGILTVRRPQPNRQVRVWSLDTSDNGSIGWEHFELQSGDLIVFQWHVDESK